MKKLFSLLLMCGILYVLYYFIMTVVGPAINNKKQGGENTIPDESSLSLPEVPGESFNPLAGVPLFDPEPC